MHIGVFLAAACGLASAVIMGGATCGQLLDTCFRLTVTTPGRGPA